MTENHRQLVARWFEEVWNQGRYDTIDELLADSCPIEGLPSKSGGPARGRADFKQFANTFRRAFPDIHITIEDVITEGDKVAVRFTATGTHKGQELGYPASGQPIRTTGMCIARIRDGQIVEAWNNFDFLSVLQQTGAVKTP